MPLPLSGFLTQKVVGFTVKLATEKAVSIRGKIENASGEWALGMYRVAKGHLSKCDKPSFAARLGRYRNAVRHVSPGERRLTAERMKKCGVLNIQQRLQWLNVNRLQKCAENYVFAPNISVKEKKYVVWCIDCCDIWMNNDAKCHAAIRR